MIKIIDYPQLKLISWNRHSEYIDEEEALSLYERNWQYLDQKTLSINEQKLIDHLVLEYGKNVLHV